MWQLNQWPRGSFSTSCSGRHEATPSCVARRTHTLPIDRPLKMWLHHTASCPLLLHTSLHAAGRAGSRTVCRCIRRQLKRLLLLTEPTADPHRPAVAQRGWSCEHNPNTLTSSVSLPPPQHLFVTDQKGQGQVKRHSSFSSLLIPNKPLFFPTRSSLHDRQL